MNPMKENPYIGPRTFREDERDRFFGREREANELLARVLSEQEIVFYAQSGAGKSSLVNARLIPDIKKKGFEVLLGRLGGDAPNEFEVDNIFVFNFLRSTATNEVDINSLSKRSLINILVPEADGDSEPIERSSKRRALIIDQFEEIFSTHHEAWEKRREFFEQLAQVLEADPRLHVVLVMREDYIAYLDPYANIFPNQARARYYMQQLERDAALKAVIEPAKAGRHPYKPGVAEQLIDDLRSVKVNRPDGTETIEPGQYVEAVQLQVVCSNLWKNLNWKDSDDGQPITADDLKKVGDVSASLRNFYATRVEEVAAVKNISQRKIRTWFTEKLISPTGVRNMVLQEREGKSGGLENDVIKELSDLVRAETRGGSTFYELTHDRLVEPVLEDNKDWFEENLSDLERLAESWNKNNRQESWLRTGPALKGMEEWAGSHEGELTNVEQDFIKACKEADKRARRTQIINAVLATLVVISIIAMFSAFYQGNQANKLAAAARTGEVAANKASTEAYHAGETAIAAKNEANSSELSAIALERSDSQLDLAILLGVRAYTLNNENSQAQKALLTLLQKSNHFDGLVEREEDTQEIQYLLPDGKLFASRDKQGITLWDANNHKPLMDTPIINGHSSPVYSLAFSPDPNTKIMATGAEDGSIVLWDAEATSPTPIGKPLKRYESTIWSLAFSPDGKILASGDEAGRIILWNVGTHEVIGEPLQQDGPVIWSLAFSPDGKTLASGSEDSTIILWNMATRKAIGDPLNDHTSGVFTVAFSPDGKLLASGGRDRTIIFWDVSTGKPTGSPLRQPPGDVVRGLAFSPDGKILASSSFRSSDPKVFLWDVAKREQIGDPLVGHTGYVRVVAFSPDGKTLASSSSDNTIILWNVEKGIEIKALEGHTKAVRGMAYSPDGNTIVSASEDGTVRFWNVSDPENPTLLGKPLHGNPIPPDNMQFSADGSLLQSTASDGQVLFDLTTQPPTELGKGGFFDTDPKDNFILYQVTDPSGENIIHVRDRLTRKDIGVPGNNPRLIPNENILVYDTVDKDTSQSQTQLWNITDNKQIEQIAPFPTASYQTSSPNGRILVYLTTDQVTGQTSIILWDVEKAQPVGEGSMGSFIGISNQVLLYKTYDGKKALINLWKIPDRSMVKSIEVDNDNYLASADGQVLAFTTQDNETTYINLADTATGNTLNLPAPANTSIRLNSLSPNGNVLLYTTTTGQDTSVSALDTRSGSQIGNSLKGSLDKLDYPGFVLAYQVYDNNEGKYAFSLISTVTGINVRDGNDIDEGYSVTYSLPDGRTLVYQTSTDSKWYLQNTYGGSPAELGGSYLTSTSDGKTLLYKTTEGDNNLIHIWDTVKNVERGSPIKGTYLGLSPDGKTMITKSDSNAIIFWDITKTSVLGEPVAENVPGISTAALNPDGKTLAFTDSNGITVMDPVSDKKLKTLPNPHNGAVTNISLSADKNILLTTGEDGNTIAWDLKSFQPLSDPITGTASSFSPKEKFLAVADGDKNTVTVWDLTNHKAVAEPFNGQTFFFSQDEKFIVIIDGTNNTAALWSLAPVKKIDDLPATQKVVFSPDSKTLALIYGDLVTLWDKTTHQIIGRSFAGPSVTFSPDNQTVAMYDKKNNTSSLVLFDITNHSVIGEPAQGLLVPNPDAEDTFLVVNGIANTTTFWDWKTRNTIEQPIEGNGSFIGMKAHILLIRDYARNKTSLWKPVTQEQISKTLTGIYTPSFSPDGTLISLADESTKQTIIWDLKTNEPVGKALDGYLNPTFCSDNKTVAAFDSKTNHLIAWDLAGDDPLGKLTLDDLNLNEQNASAGVSITFNSSCNMAAIANNPQNQTVLWNITTNKVLTKVPIAGSDGARFSNAGAKVTIIDRNNEHITFWDIAGDRPIGDGIDGYGYISRENSQIMRVTKYDSDSGYSYTMWNLDTLKPIGGEQLNFTEHFTTDGKLIFYGKDGVTFWDIAQDGPTGRSLKGHSTPITALRLSPPDGNLLASFARDGIILTDLKTQSNTLLDMGEYSGQLNGLMAFNQDGTTLTALGSDGMIFRWDVTKQPPALLTLNLVAPYKGFADSVYRITLSPNAKFLAYEIDQKINIWNIDTPNQSPFLSIDITENSDGAIVFTPDEKSIFYNDGGTIFRLDDLQSVATSSKIKITSFRQNNISDLSLILDNDTITPKYLIVNFVNQTSSYAQFVDLIKYSKVGDQITGYAQTLSSNSQTQILIYKGTESRLIKWNFDPSTWVTLLCARAHNRPFTDDEWIQYVGTGKPQPVCP